MSTRDFEILVEAHYEDLYRFAYSLARNPDEACDLTQQTFAVYAEKADQIREPLKRKSWLFTTLYREFLKTRSRGCRVVSMEEADLEIHQAVVESGVQRETEQQEMLEELAALDADQRAILTLFYLDQHSYKDIAGILGIPAGTVMSRLSRAKEALRARFEKGRKTDGIKIVPIRSDRRKEEGHG
ncbi:MAG TPA: RNA polymerase sigma factor [Chthoniobacterales bacterium]